VVLVTDAERTDGDAAAADADNEEVTGHFVAAVLRRDETATPAMRFISFVPLWFRTITCSMYVIRHDARTNSYDRTTYVA
jgi:hypothetical protein